MAIGYGDIHATFQITRAIVIIFILVTFVTVPIQLNILVNYLTLRSPFRESFVPKEGERHVIVCGNVNDKSKLETFFKEFFHPDRAESSECDYHAVIFGNTEPNEAVRSLLISPLLDARATYVIGSALSVEDLKRIAADKADAMFFLCNADAQESAVRNEDAAIILRALSVANFNNHLNCLVQIIKPEDRKILRDSDVNVILCLNEFKMSILARNAVCPGFATFIENIFHSFGDISREFIQSMDPWYSEYLHGAKMEFYFCELSEIYLHAMNYKFKKVAEGLYLEYGVIVLGLFSNSDNELVLNPNKKDIPQGTTNAEFALVYNRALIIADDQIQADQISKSLRQKYVVDAIIQKCTVAETNFKVSKNEKIKQFKNISRNVIGSVLQEHKTILQRKVQNSNENAGLPIISENTEGEIGPSRINETNRKGDDENSSEEADMSDVSDDEDEGAYIGFKDSDIAKTAVQAAVSKSSTSLKPKFEKSLSGKFSSFPKATAVNREAGGGSPNKLSQPAAASTIDTDEEKRYNKKSENVSESYNSEHKTINQEDQVVGTSELTRSVPKRRSEPLKAAVDSSSLTVLPSVTDDNLEGEDIGNTLVSSPIRQKPTMSRTVRVLGPPIEAILKRIESPEAKGSLISARTLLPKLNDINETTLDAKYLDDAVVRKKKAAKKVKKLKSQIRARLLENNNKSSPDNVENKLMSLEGRNNTSNKGQQEPVISVVSELNRPKATNSFASGMNKKNFLLNAAKQSVKANTEPEAPAPSGREESQNVKLKNKMGTFVNLAINVGKAGTNLKRWSDGYGNEAVEVKCCSALWNHIIISGGTDDGIEFFISELRRPSVRRQDYHPIVIVREATLTTWESIHSRYNDIYLIKGWLTKTQIFSKLNVSKAFSIIIFAATSSKVVYSSTDSAALFSYLKVQPYVPSNVSFTAELTSGSTVAVLNATILRRIRDKAFKQICNDNEVNAADPELKSNAIHNSIHDKSGLSATFERQFCDVMHTHHVLPVFAAGMAYTPSSFESLLVQSFYNIFTSVICEKLVCGQKTQSVTRIQIPKNFCGKNFVDLYRLLLQSEVLCFGLFRAPQRFLSSNLPYVFISPPHNSVLYEGDYAMVFGTSSNVFFGLTAMAKV